MTNVLLRYAAIGAALVLAHAPAAAQEPLPVLLPWGINGAQVAAQLEAGELRVHLTRAGRDVHAASPNRHTQAVAILTNDSLVGLIYFHPENSQHNAPDLFSLAAGQAERVHGPPVCRRSDLAVWTVEHGILEVSLRRPAGDGAAGAEIRYIGPGYAEEVARRAAARPPTPRRAPAAATRSGRTGPRLLGTAADSVQAPPLPEPAVAPEPAVVAVPADAAAPSTVPTPPTLPTPTAEYCTAG